MCVFRGLQKDAPPGKGNSLACLPCNIAKKPCIGAIMPDLPEGKVATDYKPSMPLRAAIMQDLMAKGWVTQEQRDRWFTETCKSLRSSPPAHLLTFDVLRGHTRDKAARCLRGEGFRAAPAQEGQEGAHRDACGVRS